MRTSSSDDDEDDDQPESPSAPPDSPAIAPTPAPAAPPAETRSVTASPKPAANAIVAPKSPRPSAPASNPSASPRSSAPAPSRAAPDHPPLASPSSVAIAKGPLPDETPETRLQETIARMRKVMLALDAYAVKHGRYPAAAAQTPGGPPVSWRVAILAELGYPDLLASYDTSKPWDSPTNERVLKQIPPEYQFPWRVDVKTNFLAVNGPGCAFSGDVAVPRSEFFDGVDKTVFLVECGDAQAIPWTAPVDHDFRESLPAARLGHSRQGGFLSAWGDGEIRRLETTLPAGLLVAPFTIAGGETVDLATLTKRADAVATWGRRSVDRKEVEQAFARLSEGFHALTPSNPQGEPSLAADERRPVPDQDELDAARKRLKLLYKDDIAKATSWTKKSELVKRMLLEAEKYSAEPPAYHAMLTMVRTAALATGDYPEAATALDRQVAAFKLDDLAERVKLLSEFKSKLKPDQLPEFVKDADVVAARALAADDLAAAKTALEALAGGLRRGDKEASEIRAAQARVEQVDERRRAQAKAIEAKKRLKESPDDPDANVVVGVYLAVHQGDWEGGLSHLAKGAEPRLKTIANLELLRPVDPTQMLGLGDLWWEFGEKKEKSARRATLARGVFWYRRCVEQLPATADRARAEKRIEQAKSELTETALETLLGKMTDAPPPSS